jgi:hypothetical protein
MALVLFIPQMFTAYSETKTLIAYTPRRTRGANFFPCFNKKNEQIAPPQNKALENEINPFAKELTG